jgi:hypothetical protein
MEYKTKSWLTKEVDIPRALQELHGTRAPISTLVLTYLCGVIAAAAVVVRLLPEGLPLWKVALTGLLFLDIGGGVAANFSAPTQRYYQEHANLRLPFIALHVFHPAVLALLFPESLWYFVVTGVFTLAATLAVNAIKNPEKQKTPSYILVFIGMCLVWGFVIRPSVLIVFAPLFMVKLIMGFAVKRKV